MFGTQEFAVTVFAYSEEHPVSSSTPLPGYFGMSIFGQPLWVAYGPTSAVTYTTVISGNALIALKALPVQNCFVISGRAFVRRLNTPVNLF